MGLVNQIPVEHWENTKLKCNKISTFQNHRIEMQWKWHFTIRANRWWHNSIPEIWLWLVAPLSCTSGTGFIWYQILLLTRTPHSTGNASLGTEFYNF